MFSIPKELTDHIIYFTQNPVFELSLVNKYFSMNVKKIRITSNEKYPCIGDKHLEQLPNLTKLHLRDYPNYVASNFPQIFLKDRVLILYDMKLYDEGKITDEGLAKIPYLTDLKLTNNQTITDEGLSKLVNLNHLIISGITKVTAKGIFALSNLISLDLHGSHLIATEDLKGIELSCKKLWVLINKDGKARFFCQKHSLC